MPKTKDAFAMCDLYNALFSVLDYEFIPVYSGRSFNDTLESVTYLNNPAGRVEEILKSYLDRNNKNAYLDIENDKSFNSNDSDFEFYKKNLSLYKERIKELRKSIERTDKHIVLLQSYERTIFEYILSEGFNDRFKSKGNRVKMLIKKYEWLIRLLSDYEILLTRDYKNQEEKFQQECRNNFGKRLRQARIEKKISIEEMAKKIGITRTGYGYYELGQRDLPTPTIYRLAEILDVSTDWLFGLKN